MRLGLSAFFSSVQLAAIVTLATHESLAETSTKPLLSADTSSTVELILAAEKKRDYDTAIPLITVYIQKNPLDALAYFRRGTFYLKKDDLAHALEDFEETIRLRPSLAKAHVHKGMTHRRLKEYEHAIAAYSEAIKLEPRNASSYEFRAMVYRRQEKPNLAIADLDRGLKFEPHNVDMLLSRAELYRGKGAYCEALDDIDKALLVASSRARLDLERGQIYYRQGEYRKAVQAFEEAMHDSSDKWAAYNDAAWCLAVASDENYRDPKKAIEYAKKAYEQGGTKARNCADTLAAAYAADGQFIEAVKYQQEAIELGGDDGHQRRLELYKARLPYIDPPPKQKEVAWDVLRHQTFETVWGTVDQEYFDIRSHEVDWAAMRDKYRLPLSDVMNDDDLRGLLQKMLNELHRTHFGIVSRSTAVFNPEERSRQGTVGAHLAFLDHRLVITEVSKNSPAFHAMLKPGDALVSVDGYLLGSAVEALTTSGLSYSRAGLYLKDSTETHFGGRVGGRFNLVVENADGEKRDVMLESVMFDGTWSEPVGNSPSMPIQIETIRRENGIAYARFNVFALPIVKPLKTFFRSLAPTDGLIIDLRGNPGGTILIGAGLAGWLSDKEFAMGMVRVREGEMPLDVFPQARAFTGPVAVLLDASSASTSEIFSEGLREAGRARLFGETTAGAALPSVYKRLPNGDLFQYALGDIRTISGRLLEGAGVQPDERIACSREDYAAGRDPVVAAAQTWIDLQRKHTPAYPVKN